MTPISIGFFAMESDSQFLGTLVHMTRKMHAVMPLTDVKRRVVVVGLAFALRVLGALDGKREAAIRPEFPAGILLPVVRQ